MQVPLTSAVPSPDNSTVSRGALGIPCDVTSVVATPTALRTFLGAHGVQQESCSQD